MTSRLHRFGLWLVFICIALAAAITMLPARWLILLVPNEIPVSIGNASGTVWAGQAWLTLGPAHYQRTLPDPVRWHLGWHNYLPAITLSHPWLAGPLTLKPQLTGLDIPAQTLQMPATVLGLLHPAIRQLAPEGSLRLQWPALHLGPKSRPSGTFTINWQQAASGLSQVRPLGDYLLTTRQSPDTVDMTLTSQQGPLLLTGQGSLKQGRFVFDGKAMIDPRADTLARTALNPLLQVLGPVNNNQVLLRFH